MKQLLYEFNESFRIAYTQIRANKTRSILTALGVIIGIVAVTLMGTAISGIDSGFDSSMALLGKDVLYVTKSPWIQGPNNWWKFRNRPAIKTEMAEQVKRIVTDLPNTLIDAVVPTVMSFRTVKYQDSQVTNVFTMGTTEDYLRTSSIDFKDGRFFNELEAKAGRNVIVIGSDVEEALFPNGSALGKTIQVSGQEFKVIGVLAKQGSFLGNSFDSQVMLPLVAFKRYFNANANATIRVKVKDQNRLDDARDELTGIMRRVRQLSPERDDNFAINGQDIFKSQYETIKFVIVIAGFLITGLSLLVGAIGIMNITFVSVKERTKEIGTRKALGARKRTILMQFLIESVSICLIGGIIGTVLSFFMSLAIKQFFPSEMPVNIVIVAMVLSIVTGIVSGFAPAYSAAKLDPVEALRYE
jgi:putative ABC transport system permease protein